MNRKNLPLIMMLVAGLITWVIAWFQSYTLVAKLGALLGVLLVFYAIGTVFVWFLNHFDKVNEQNRIAENEELVIEKEPDPENVDVPGAGAPGERTGEESGLADG